MNAASILRTIDHREYPLPTGPWVMTQTWHELLFAHWPVTVEALRPLIPALLEIDTFKHEAWVGVVPFRMSNVRPRNVPAVRGLSAFPELNVRTYVTFKGIPGVYFFSLDAGNPLAVAMARAFFHLPYFNAAMQCKRTEATIHYSSHRIHRDAPAADFVAAYRPVAPVFFAQRSSIEHWLTERYSLYTTFQQHVYRGEIHHIQWPLQIAELEVTRNTMAQAHAIFLPHRPPLLHYAHKQEVLIWALRKVM